MGHKLEFDINGIAFVLKARMNINWIITGFIN
jgi:hypothetical protein